MKNIVRVVCFMLVLIFILSSVGCTLPTINNNNSSATSSMSEEEALKAAYKKDPTKFVRFYKSTGVREKYVPVDEIKNYQSQYADCNGTWYKEGFSGEELLIYNSYIYAMEHNYISIDVYVNNSQRDFYYIREALSMDTPFMEQNFNRYGESIGSNRNDRHGQSIGITVEQFTARRWEKRLEALEKCREIVANIPEQYDTQLKKMEYLYRYVCDNVEYVEYDNMADNDYLYDAVIKGKTVCDGYSNMLNLLFNLIGVECCEAMGSNIKDYDTATPEELENATGHTWVVARVDGKFYNFDPTFEDGTFTEDPNKPLLYFGYSDKRASIKHFDCEERRPKCTKEDRDTLFADVVVGNLTDNTNIMKIADKAKQNYNKGDRYTYVAVSQNLTDQQVKSFFNKYATKITFGGRMNVVWIADSKAYTILQIKHNP